MTWRPLVQISGRKEFNELFLEEVRVPAASMVGPAGQGVADHPRRAGARARHAVGVRLQDPDAERRPRAGGPLYRRVAREGGGRGGDVATLRERVAQAWIEAEVFAAHTLRVLPHLHGKEGATRAALQKLFGSEIQQRAQETAMALPGGYGALARDPRAYAGGEWYETYLYSKSVTIASGTSEILRSMIAQQALGLPRD